MNQWLLLFIAGLFEVVWVTGLKYSATWWAWTGTIIMLILSFDLLLRCSKKLPVGTVYAVFTGIGTAGTVATEMILFGEPLVWSKLALILLLVAGVLGLKVVTPHPKKERSE